MDNAYANIKVLVADCNHLIRSGLIHFLQQHQQIQLVGHASSCEELLALTLQLQPDVVITEIAMKNTDGIDAPGKVAALHPSIAIIAHDAFHNVANIEYMKQASIRGFVQKDAEPEELIAAIQAVDMGNHYYCSAISEKIARWRTLSGRKGKGKPKPLFNALELQVIKLLCKEYTNKEMAAETFASTRTIESAKARLLSKTLSKNSCGIALYAFKNNLCQLYLLLLSFITPGDWIDFFSI